MKINSALSDFLAEFTGCISLYNALALLPLTDIASGSMFLFLIYFFFTSSFLFLDTQGLPF